VALKLQKTAGDGSTERQADRRDMEVSANMARMALAGVDSASPPTP